MGLFWVLVAIAIIFALYAISYRNDDTNTELDSEKTVKEIDFYDSLKLHPEKEFRCETTNGDIYSINLLHSERKLVIVNITAKNVIRLNYRDILKCDVQQDNSTITESSAGAALTGLVFFGVEGAIVGASSKSSKNICSNLSIRIITNEILNPNIIITLIHSSINRQSTAYRKLIQFADEIYSTIMAIIGDNYQRQMAIPSYNVFSQPMNSNGLFALGASVQTYQKQMSQQYQTPSVLYDVILKNSGERKSYTIEVIRELTGLGFEDSKEIAENPGRKILSNVSRQSAENAQYHLHNTGAVVDIIPVQNFVPDNQMMQFRTSQNLQVPYNGQVIPQSDSINIYQKLSESTLSDKQNNFSMNRNQNYQ